MHGSTPTSSELAADLRDCSPEEHAELVAVLDRLARDLVTHRQATRSAA